MTLENKKLRTKLACILGGLVLIGMICGQDAYAAEASKFTNAQGQSYTETHKNGHMEIKGGMTIEERVESAKNSSLIHIIGPDGKDYGKWPRNQLMAAADSPAAANTMPGPVMEVANNLKLEAEMNKADNEAIKNKTDKKINAYRVSKGLAPLPSDKAPPSGATQKSVRQDIKDKNAKTEALYNNIRAAKGVAGY